MHHASSWPPRPSHAHSQSPSYGSKLLLDPSQPPYAALIATSTRQGAAYAAPADPLSHAQFRPRSPGHPVSCDMAIR